MSILRVVRSAVVSSILPAILSVLLVVPSQAQEGTARAVIDAGEMHAPISPHLYGQFIEHAGHLINDVLWAEMLDDRKYYHPIVATATPPRSATNRMRRPAVRRWTSIGDSSRVVMDTHRPFVGQEPQVEIEQQLIGGVPGQLQLPPFSVSIYRLPAR